MGLRLEDRLEGTSEDPTVRCCEIKMIAYRRGPYYLSVSVARTGNSTPRSAHTVDTNVDLIVVFTYERSTG